MKNCTKTAATDFFAQSSLTADGLQAPVPHRSPHRKTRQGMCRAGKASAYFVLVVSPKKVGRD
ncbi:MAG: hypothetical protein ABS987_11360, partial [Ruminococcus sp.]